MPCIPTIREKALQTVHQTFEPNIPVILHLPAFTNTTVDMDSIPTLFVIQEGRHCMPTTDYYFTNIQPDPITVSPQRRNHSKLTAQHTATKDQIPQQTHPLWPGKTRVYPSMQAALAHTMAQCNPTVKRGPAK